MSPSSALDGAASALSKAVEVKDRAQAVREQLGELAPQPTDDSEDEEEEATAAAEADQAASTEPTAASVDYTNTWRDAPPSTIVVTRIEQRPAATQPPPPAPSYEPRAHGFVGLSLRGTTVNRNPSALTGGRIGFVFDDRFTIGGVFYSLTARYGGPIVDPVGNKLGLRMAYGGVMLGWTFYKGRVTRVGFETVAAAGAACISTSRRMHGRWGCIERVGLVSLEPGLSVAFTVTDWVRLGFTGGYRFITREAWREPNDFTLSGPFVGLDIDFGAFRERGER